MLLHFLEGVQKRKHMIRENKSIYNSRRAIHREQVHGPVLQKKINYTYDISPKIFPDISAFYSVHIKHCLITKAGLCKYFKKM